MTPIAGARALYTAQRQFTQQFNAELQRVADLARGILLRAASADGTIPKSRLEAVQTEIGTLFQRLFVGENMRSPFRNEVEPLAPYSRLLNKWYVFAVVSVVRAQRDMMAKTLAGEPDIINWLAQAEPVTELVYRNPLLSYDPMHTFVDKRGYTLSRNIWGSSLETRMKIDALLDEGVTGGTSAINLAKRLESFVLGKNQASFTNKPYGRKANYPALRLASTEIAAAHGRLTIAASNANPFVNQISWVVSATHRDKDECDENAANSPFDLDNVPDFPNHPLCKCVLIPIVAAKPKQVIEELRTMMRRGERPPLTPLSFRNLLRALLGAYLYTYAVQEFGEMFR